MEFRFIPSLSDIDKDAWDSLRSCDYPFLSYAFLHSLEESGSVGQNTGWTPMHLVGEENGRIVLAMPLYQKTHSYGEYVFDWQWAQAYEQHGLRYFPKLLCAIPFTPASGPRLLSQQPADETLLKKVFEAISSQSAKEDFSSWHLLFPKADLKTILSKNNDLLEREDVQFHWRNQDYSDFEQFLAGFRSSKRKQIRRERRKVAEQGIQLIQKTGAEMTEQDWQNFYHCYKATYYKRSGHSGYLNWTFFELIAASMQDQIMVVFALDGATDEVIASSLFFFDSETLYGRYWGAIEERDCLHFEACYYQGIDFAIDRKLRSFNPGTQGEHKLVRGFEPVITSSFHWIQHPQFSAAIDEFLARERASIERYKEASADYLPFHKNPG